MDSVKSLRNKSVNRLTNGLRSTQTSSAAALKMTTRCSESIVMIASIAEA
jgi:hypothetical protein